MAKRFIQVLCVLVMAGCVSAGNPWSGTHNRVAAAAPSALVPAAVTQPRAQPGPGVGGLQQAGIEVYNLGGTPAPQPDMGMPRQDMEALPSAPPLPADTATAALPPVKVGLLVPLSGKHRELGQAMLQSAQLALFDMGYESFELLPRDTAKGAQQAAQSAVDNGAQLLLGPLFAADVRDAQPVARRNNINMVAFSTDWTLADSNTYIMGFLPFGQVQRIAEYAASRGYRHIGVLAPDNDYGSAVVSAWNNVAYRGGGMTSDIMRFSAQQNDINNIARSFSHYQESNGTPADNPPPYDAVLLPVGADQARSIASALNYYNLGPQKVRRLSTGLWDEPGLAAEPALDGAWFAAPSPELRRGFEQRYTETYGSAPPRLSTLAYDATALAAVLARTGYTQNGRPAFDAGSLTNPNGFAGIDGIFRFRPDGLVERAMAVLEFRGGRIVQIDPAQKTFQRYAGQ
jgi:ABC-type branched-subunit amino acid transport system substrate-binding protein